ncbi:MAG: HAD family hydrolase [Candidatus Methanoplasma sp.]|jgi:phosphoglycolate phosphatase-like HAD superfamily hydrolase|nr:HAD family hydrolase [Candidatus Methanoplasma sp.]
MEKYDFYIFDLDNTLVDSRVGYEKAFTAAFGEFGIPYDPALYNEYIRTPLDITFSERCPDSPCRYRDFLSVMTDTYEKTCLDGVRLFPDAQRCLERLSGSGCKMGIVSNSYMAQIRRILLKLGIGSMFSSVVGQDRVGFAKPDPEPVILCMSEMNGTPGRTVMVGDSANDVLAGMRAGVFSVLIDRYGENTPQGEYDAYITSLDEL